MLSQFFLRAMTLIYKNGLKSRLSISKMSISKHYLNIPQLIAHYCISAIAYWMKSRTKKVFYSLLKSWSGIFIS